MMLRKRVTACILAAAMVVSSSQLSVGSAYAQELTPSVQEDASGGQTDEQADGALAGGQEQESGGIGGTEQKETQPSEEMPATGDGEDASGEGGASDIVEPSGEESSGGNDILNEDGENDVVNPGRVLYNVQISGNDLPESEASGIMAWDELDGVYQFGGAPSAKGNISTYSVSSYSNAAMEYLYQQMLERETEIDVSAYDIEVSSLESLVSGVLNEHPDLYFVYRGCSCSVSGTKVTRIVCTYIDTYDDDAFRKSTSAALSCVDSRMSDVEKAVILHDYLTVNCEYDYQNYLNNSIPDESYTAYGTLVNRTAVCQGYALAYKYLLSQVGIDCYMVTSDSMNHAWNLIVLDGEYYQVDVTWDDPTWDQIGRSVHTYMFRSDAAFAEHSGWRVTRGSDVVDYTATDTRYDSAFWTKCRSPLVIVDDDCFYVSSNGTLRKTKLAEVTDEGTVVQSIGSWPVWGGGGSWVGAFSGLFRIDDRLFYNDKTYIYSIAMNGTDRRTEFTADTTEGYIYGSAYCQGKVLYSLHQTPKASGKETVLTADITVGGGGSSDVPVERIDLNAYTLELAEGEEAELTAAVYPENATDSAVIWTSDDPTVAEAADGRVKAVSAGSCTVTASAGGKKAECSVLVTAGAGDGTLNLDNFTAEYTALDGTKISSAADGKPKLLIFYSNNCYNCRSTIRSISGKIADFAGVDVYAIETSMGTKESVIDFRTQYGCDEIVFSYDTGAYNGNSMWKYVDAGGFTNPSWPVICYIDANNRLQYVTISVTTADTVLANLKKYCNYSYQPPEVYTITYVLDGGTNNDGNPCSYTSETDTVSLQDAVRDGYQFEGWYGDETYAVKVTEIIQGSTGDLTLYAKWSVISYTITYVLDGGANDGANPSTYTVETDTVILRDAFRSGYQFDGWYSDASRQTRVTGIVKGSTGDLTLYAKWREVLDTSLPEVDLTPLDGNIVMGFSGTYFTESADKILNRLNEIRLEACEKGITNPRTGSPLTMDDYVPLKWSSDLEAIARLRAAEASVNHSHTRLNGSSCFTAITNNRVRSTAENLAWNYAGLMSGIEQWYEEKSDWVNQTGKVTGHYTSIINPEYTCVAVGAFRLSTGGWYSVAQEFSRSMAMDGRKNDTQGSCVQYMEVTGNAVKELQFNKNLAGFIKEGDTYQLPLNVTVTYSDYYGTHKDYSGPYQAGGSWSSSDQTVALVDNCGTVTAKAKGAATITVSGGDKSAFAEISVYGADENPIVLQRPAKTTYKVGQKIDLTGGKVTCVSDGKTETVDLKADMISGFDSANPGICTVTVTCGGYAVNFDTLIVEEPALTAVCGQTLGELPFPSNSYGTYSWQDDTQIIERVGVWTFQAVFTPDDEQLFQQLTDLTVQVTAQMELGDAVEVTFKSNTYTYNGTEQEPKVVVTALDTVLAEGQDYTLYYQNNRNAGTATVIVEGVNYYHGSISRTFEIEPAQAVIAAKNKTILIGTPVPAESEYEYEISGLMQGDSLTVLPSFFCNIISSEAAGRYDIVPYGADAGSNYVISYTNGRLIVASEFVSCTVTFDMQGHGTALADYVGIQVGSTIDRPENPSAPGYRFDGWYRDAACTKAWNFDTDIVQSDMTLYAKWLGESDQGGFALQEIADVIYTGKACKPAVSVYDGETLLKAGKDYQIKYYNNVDANIDGIRKEEDGKGIHFNPMLPYVEITGKGNYTEVTRVNFNILRASIGAGSDKPASGVTLKVTDQLVTASGKTLKPFSSIKYVKAMRRDVDFTVGLHVVNARDESGKSLEKDTVLKDAVIPAGYEGEFLLTVQGTGNYEGSISKKIQVTDKMHLIKNAKVTLGKNLKNIVFTGKAVELTPAGENTADTFSVKCGDEFLRYKKDYTVDYRNNDRVGKAELIITGMGEYAGSKAVTFNIKGRTFSARTVQVAGVTSRVYTGRALTQNDVLLTYGVGTDEERALSYGTDYAVSYSKNVNKGTATMTFKGLNQAGFSGSFKKTFKIAADNIAQVKQSEEMQNITLSYCKAGAKPMEQIVLTNGQGFVLRNGKDYTLKYVNNKAVADATAEKPPTVVIKGKGNYTGEFGVCFNIREADLQNGLDDGSIRVKTSPVAYNPNKAETYAYKPAVKLMDGKTALRAGTDYEIEYVNNTQADYENYMQALEAGWAAESDRPQAVITEKAGAAYMLNTPIVVPLPIYQNKLVKADMVVEIGEAVYTGGQVTPTVTVYYPGTAGLILLEEGKDYSITYGTNVKSGKNAGSVTISGVAPYYGGSVTVKFEIKRKPIMY